MFFKGRKEKREAERAEEREVIRAAAEGIESEAIREAQAEGLVKGQTPAVAAEERAEEEKKEGRALTFDYDKDENLKKEFEQYKVQKILHRIDHTLLKQDAGEEELRQLADEANEYGFYAVCVHPCHIGAVKRRLGEKSKVKVATVVGFPMGENTAAVKAYETKQAVKDGADEIDMVICVSAVKRGDFRYVKREIQKVVSAAKKRPVKVIVETSLLLPKELEKVAALVPQAGGTFVKTSTGYFGEGATAANVRAIRDVVGNKCSIKASGGIRTADDVLVMLEAGADRIGTSSGVRIAKELRAKINV